MAIVTGPLYSEDARGKFGAAVVFTGWNGRKVARKFVKPSNPMTTDQVLQRNQVRVTGSIQHWVNATTLKASGQTLTDQMRINAITPTGYAWNGFLVQEIIGKQNANYLAARAAFAAIKVAHGAAWDSAAAALTPVMPAVVQVTAGNVPTDSISDGEVWFIYQYALFTMGLLVAAPGNTPPTYA